MYGKIYNPPLSQPKQSRVRVHRPNRRYVSLAVTEKCKCQCWVTKWRLQIIPQFWSADSKAAWSEAGSTSGKHKSQSAAERRWRRLVLAVTRTHSSWRYCSACWWRHLMMIVQSLRTILSGTGNHWRSSPSVDVMRSNFRFRIMSRAAEC